MTLRSSLYKGSRFLGDVNAAQHGRLPKRLTRRATMRSILGPTLNKLWR